MSEDRRLERLRDNLAYLENNTAELEELLQRLGDVGQLYEQVEAAGWRNILIPVGPQFVPCHRAPDPFGEWSENLDADTRPDLVVAFGTGFGYQLLKLYARLSEQTGILIIESRLEPLFVLLTEIDLAKVLPVGARILFTDDPLRAAQAVKQRLSRYTNTNISFTSLNSFDRYAPEFVRTVVSDVQTSWSRHTVFIDSLSEQHSDITNNALEHLSRMQGCHRIRSHSAQNLTALILASGPSLSENLALIKACARTMYLISVGSALHPLLDHGITPDLVVVNDPKPVNLAHFPLDAYDIPIAFDPVVHPDILKKFKGPRIVLHSGHAIVELFADLFSLEPLHNWGTVTSSALALAAEAGFATLGIVGADFSYAGSSSHADGYLLGGSIARKIILDDLWGRPVASNTIFRDYAEFVAAQIARLEKDGVRVCNCCESGILRGGQIMSMRQFYHAFGSLTPERGHWVPYQPLPSPSPTSVHERLHLQFEEAIKSLLLAVGGHVSLNECMSQTLLAAVEGHMLDEFKQLDASIMMKDDAATRACFSRIQNRITAFVDRIRSQFPDS